MGQGRDLTVRDEMKEGGGEIAFSILEGKDVFQDFGVSHTKEMHLIVVRNDLRHFAHLHPERDVRGSWHVAYTPPAGGTYWIYADFVDRENNGYTLRFDRTYSGDVGSVGLAKDFARERTVDGVRVKLEPKATGSTVTFTYTLTDEKGKPVQLEEYLGALGHSVLIAPDGDFFHTHPSSERPVFETTLRAGTFYRVFIQFQVAGKVLTVSFDWEQPPEEED
jgi:hypothetical protein